MPENGRQHRGNGMMVFFGRCHLPNVTAVERLKSRWALILSMSTRVAITARSLRVMVPSARKWCWRGPECSTNEEMTRRELRRQRGHCWVVTANESSGRIQSCKLEYWISRMWRLLRRWLVWDETWTTWRRPPRVRLSEIHGVEWTSKLFHRLRWSLQACDWRKKLQRTSASALRRLREMSCRSSKFIRSLFQVSKSWYEVQ